MDFIDFIIRPFTTMKNCPMVCKINQSWQTFFAQYQINSHKIAKVVSLDLMKTFIPSFYLKLFFFLLSSSVTRRLDFVVNFGNLRHSNFIFLHNFLAIVGSNMGKFYIGPRKISNHFIFLPSGKISSNLVTLSSSDRRQWTR